MPPAISLTGRRVIVSGSTRGLGLAFAGALCRAGAAVVVNGRDPSRCDAVAAGLRREGGMAVSVAGSVADTDDVARLVAAAVDTWGGIDVVVNNAGITRDSSVLKMSVEDFDEVVAVHLRGTWDLTRQAAVVMREGGGGAVLNLVSGSALFGLVGQSNYAAAKGGVLALTRALSRELAPYDITVNALYPAASTEMVAPVLGLAPDLARWFAPADAVAPAVVALAADTPEVRRLTGQVVSFDGRSLRLWSQPEGRAEVRRDSWSDADVVAALSALEPEPLHPDPLGEAVIDALARRTRRSSP